VCLVFPLGCFYIHVDEGIRDEFYSRESRLGKLGKCLHAGKEASKGEHGGS
jgi:hypothetical protein